MQTLTSDTENDP